jgi:hypothetical protein
MSDNKVADALDLVGDIASVLSKRGGPIGLGALGVAAILRASAIAVRERGQSVEEILKNIRQPRTLSFPWRDHGEPPTSQETPSAKKATDED